MTRKELLEAIKVAGYHGDHEEAARLYVENRISRETFDKLLFIGQKMRASGVPCSCSECK